MGLFVNAYIWLVSCQVLAESLPGGQDDEEVGRERGIAQQRPSPGGLFVPDEEEGGGRRRTKEDASHPSLEEGREAEEEVGGGDLEGRRLRRTKVQGSYRGR